MKPNSLQLLLVEDDPIERQLLKSTLAGTHAIAVECAASGEEAIAHLSRREWDAVMTDLMMPGMSGIDLIRRIRQDDRVLPIIVVTANSAVDRAVEGMRAGATEYLVKPIDTHRVLSLLERTCRDRRCAEGDALDALFGGEHSRLDEVRRRARRIAAVPFARVLITGESGTGKSLLARGLHELSGATGQFIVVNCATLPANLLESELFGHEKGAFTDAKTQKKGLIELAHEGTLFLDEIGAMPLELQAKLLLFLENHEVRRLGGTRSQVVRTRVVAATNEDLPRRVLSQTFRADLLFRLDVATLELPPLREVPQIIPQLIDRFVTEVAQQFGRVRPEVEAESVQAMTEYAWPGNVRELRNAVERALIFQEGGPLTLRPPAAATADGRIGVTLPYGLPLEEVEKRYIQACITRNPETDYARVARVLGISRKTLWEKRRRYAL